MPGIRVSVNPQVCTGCGACTRVCLPTAITLVDGKSVINELCIGCGRCVETCPEQAIKLNIDNHQFIEDTIRLISEKVVVTGSNALPSNAQPPTLSNTGPDSMNYPVEQLSDEVDIYK